MYVHPLPEQVQTRLTLSHAQGEEFTGVPPPQVEEDEANINIDRTGPGEKDRQMLNIARLLQARRGDIAAIVDHEIKRLDLIGKSSRREWTD